MRSANLATCYVANDTIELFLLECTKVIDESSIITSGEKLEELSRDPAVNSRKPRAFIYPSNADEIRTLLELANDFCVPLWVYSTGKNWGYLNTSIDEESVVVILSRMNRIIHVDNDLAYAEIEPGVTYEQLNRHLKENGYKLWTDSPGGPPSGSVIGNALDRGVGVTPYADHYGHLCGLEVLLPDGTLISTGALGLQKKGAQHLYKWGVGPIWEGVFSQSNFGVVIKAGIWLMRAPEHFSLVSLSLEEGKLEASLDEARELILKGVLPETGRFSNNVAMLTLVTQAIDENLEGKRSLTKDDLVKLEKKYRIPSWQASFCVYGDRDSVNLNSKKSSKNLKRHGKVTLIDKSKAAYICTFIEYINRYPNRWLEKMVDLVCKMVFDSTLAVVRLLPALIDLHKGIPVETVVRRGYFRAKNKRPDKDINVARDGVGVLWAVPVLPFRGSEIANFVKLCEEAFSQSEIDFYMTIMIFNARSVCPLMAILYDREDPEDCNRAQQLYSNILKICRVYGYQQFRAGINGWPDLYSEHPEMRELNNKFKDLLDPNKILSPGRYGIE